MLALLLGLLLLGLGTHQVGRLVNAGALSASHAAIDECESCHSVPHDKPMRWLAAALAPFGRTNTEQNCLGCHAVGEASTAPHGVPDADLPRPSVAPRGDGPWAAEVANRLLYPASDSIGCTSCHQEHQGRFAEPHAISDEQCQVCHSVRFSSLDDGHPDFDGYPYQRRTRINFDHASHVGKHFVEESDLAPTSCAACHVPDAVGRTMLSGSFENTCANCHGADVDGGKLAGAKGRAVLDVPGIDLLTLIDRGVAIGEWPEFAEAPVTPLVGLLLARDPGYSEARERLAGLDLLSLEQASSEQIAAVSALAWAFKRMMRDLTTDGPAALFERLEHGLAGEAPLSREDRRALGAGMPTAVVELAATSWFPKLADELASHRAGNAPATRAVRPNAGTVSGTKAAPATEGEDSAEFDDLFGGGLLVADDVAAVKASGAGEAGGESVIAMAEEMAFEDLFGGGLLTGDAAEPLEETGQPAATSVDPPAGPRRTAEERMGLGGWYLDDVALRYRPGGHADAFLRAWLDLAASNRTLDRWLDKDNPGACTKCHGVVSVGERQQLDWMAKRPLSGEHAFTVFEHSKHFSMTGDEGCRSCHVLLDGADYAVAFEQRDPLKFSSNFAPMSRATCASCHSAEQAGDACVSCHRYHVGTWDVNLPTSRLTGVEAERRVSD